MIDARREQARVARRRLERVVQLSAIKLGDKRLDRAYIDFVQALDHKPDAHFTRLFVGKERARFYRFCGNRKMTFENAFAPCVETARMRAAEHPRSLVPHDTTEGSWPVHNDKPRFQLARMSKNRQGFHLHTSLMLADEPGFEPLALCAAQPYVHRKDVEHDEEATRFWMQRGGLFDNEQQRYLSNLESCRAILEPGQALHIIDREGDDYKLLAWFAQHQERFLIRAAQDRKAQHEELGEGLLSELLAQRPVLGTRSLEVSYRPEKREKSKVVPERVDRTALLEFRSMRVHIQCSSKLPASERAGLPTEVELWVLEAREVAPPAGQERIVWRLLTSEPVEDLADAEQVMAWYGARWRIEEYFKALKTGCAYSKRQLESAQSLLGALALSMPVALHLLVLRHQARHGPALPATRALNTTQLQILEAMVPQAPKKPLSQWTVRDAFETVGLLGGWVRGPNRPLGWQVLGRGLQQLLDYEQGWNAALSAQARARERDV